MTFDELHLFLDLCESKNFSKTAAQNHMSPSTLSRQIQRMEQELGLALFIRDNRQVALTEAGEKFLPFAQQSWHNWQQFKLQVRSNSEELSGELKLFCSVTAAYSHLPSILERFRTSYPKVEIQLTTGDPALSLTMIQNQHVDLALSGRPSHLPQSIEFQHIDDISLSLIAPRVSCPANLFLQQQPINWQQIPFVLPVEGPARQRIDQWFRQQKIKHPKIYATVSGHEAIVSMVALGCGVALLPDVVIKNSPINTQVSVLNLDVPIEPFQLGVCVQKKKLDSPLIKAFWDILL